MDVPGFVWFGLPGAVFLMIGWHRYQKGRARSHGKDVERSALDAVKSRLPADWKMDTSIMTPHGDVDLLIHDIKARSFAIEVKSHTDVQVHYFLWFFWPTLKRRNGKNLLPDPLFQTRLIATYVEAEPILWYPKHTANKKVKVQGIWVVMGNSKLLFKTIRQI